MREITNTQVSVVMDRGVRKCKVNVVKDNVIFGFLKPV
jgi:hypothetical protein